jgi:hypothetical protein
MEIHFRPDSGVARATPKTSVAAPKARLPEPATAPTEQRNLDRQAANLLFSRMPSMQSLLKFSTVNGNEVTFLFRLGFFDLTEVNACIKEFQQRTRSKLRLLVEIPGRSPQNPDDKKKPDPPLQMPLNKTTLKAAARYEAARSRTVRKQEATARAAAPQQAELATPVRSAAAPRAEGLGMETVRVDRAAEERRRIQEGGRGTTPRTEASVTRARVKVKKRKPPPPPESRSKETGKKERDLKNHESTRTQEQRPVCPTCGGLLSGPLQPCPQCNRKRSRRGLVQLLQQAVGQGDL